MKNENIVWIDALRVIATFSVILLHVAAPILSQYGSISKIDWWVANAYESLVRFCVPIFLMISGTLILSKTYESNDLYFKKRILKILFPFIFWSFIYIIYDKFNTITSYESLSIYDFIKSLFVSLWNGASIHFWYIYMIIGLYLFFPILIKWIQNSNKNEIKYFIFIWAITILIQLPIFNNALPAVELTYFSGFIGFPVLGYYLNKYNIYSKNKLFSISMIFIGIIITMFGTYLVTVENNFFQDGFFYSYLSPNVVTTSIGIFLLLKNLINFSKNIILILSFFAKYCYGIYLIHILVLSVLEKFGIYHSFISPLFGIPITSILCLFISTSIIWFVDIIPLGKYISGR